MADDVPIHEDPNTDRHAAGSDPLNETHDPGLTCRIAGDAQFPIQNLPFGVFRRRDGDGSWHGGVAIGDAILDLAALAAGGALPPSARDVAHAGAGPDLNPLLALGPAAWSTLRLALSRGLRPGAPGAAAIDACLVPQAAAELAVPARVGDYTDFYASIHHATAVGRQFRPDQPLLPNYRWVPIGYHGRASSVVASGTPVRRPRGQLRTGDTTPPRFAACERLDFELELAAWVGPGNAMGEPVAVDSAAAHLFGVGLLNDWSARDIQSWEYQPLGPFLGKSFATTVSPWIVTLEALAPWRTALQRDPGEPEPLPHLVDAADMAGGAFDIELEVLLQTAAMRRAGLAPHRMARSNARHAYWTLAQLLAHHTSNGCNLRPGDLLGTGTLSGPDPDEAGSLLELTAGGSRPLQLPGGETRTFLADGDRVVLQAHCPARAGHPVSIGFGCAEGTVVAA